MRSVKDIYFLPILNIINCIGTHKSQISASCVLFWWVEVLLKKFVQIGAIIYNYQFISISNVHICHLRSSFNHIQNYK